MTPFDCCCRKQNQGPSTRPARETRAPQPGLELVQEICGAAVSAAGWLGGVLITDH